MKSNRQQKIIELVDNYEIETQEELADKLREAFASWYDNGHTNENDVNTIILKITVTDGIIYKDGKRYEF